MENLEMALSSQNLGCQKAEQKHFVNGEITPLAHALESIPVKNSTPEQISAVLRLVFIKVGLREANLPSEVEKQVLIDFIYRNYSNHKLQEISLAFDLAVMDKLGVDTNHFENFTCKYFASIMKAYRAWASLRYDDATKKPVLMLEDKKELTDEDWAELMESSKGYNLQAIPSMIYDYLIRTEKIVVTAEEKHRLIDRAVIYMLATMEPLTPEYIAFSGMKSKGIYSAKVKGQIINIAKKMAVRDYLSTLNEKTDG